jgi:hypothetical protein
MQPLIESDIRLAYQAGKANLMRRYLRSSIGLACAGSVLAVLISWQPANADRLTNTTGLGPGRFVWQPSIAPAGPIIVIATLNERIVHVYRSGTLIGVAMLEAGASAGGGGVFRIVPRSANQSLGEIKATAILVDGAAPPLLRLPREFLKLIDDAAIGGSIVIMAPERTVAVAISDGGPFLSALEEEPLRAPSVAGWTGPQDVDRPSPAPAAIVVVPVANKAFSIGGGQSRNMALQPVATPASAPTAGTHVFLRTAVTGEDGPRWLGVGIGRDDSDPHISTWLGEQALDELRLVDEQAARGLGHNLGPGAVVVITNSATKPQAMTATGPFTILTHSKPKSMMPVMPSVSRRPAAAKVLRGTAPDDEQDGFSAKRFLDPVDLVGG